MTVENSEKDAASDAIGCIPFCVFSGNREIRGITNCEKEKKNEKKSNRSYTGMAAGFPAGMPDGDRGGTDHHCPGGGKRMD